MKIINILSYATSGLFFSDIEQMIALNKIMNNQNFISFGEWQHFLEYQFSDNNMLNENANM